MINENEKKIVLFIHDGVIAGGFTSDQEIKVIVSDFDSCIDSAEGEDKFWEQCRTDGLAYFDPEIIHFEEDTD